MFGKEKNTVITNTRIERTYFQDPYYKIPTKLTPVTTNAFLRHNIQFLVVVLALGNL